MNDIQSTLAVTQSGSPPRRADWLWAALFILLGVGESLSEDPAAKVAALEILVLLVAAIGVPWRRVSAPFALLGATILHGIGLLSSQDFGMTGGSFLAFAVLLYSLARWRPPREIAVGLTVLLLVDSLASAINAGLIGDAVGTFTLWMFIASIAYVVRSRTVFQLNRIETARLSERNVLARELHDSVAHYVSAIAVQAQAAQYIARQDPEAAVKAMSEVEATANRAIVEMRRMVGVLRTSEDIARSVASQSLHELAIENPWSTINVSGDADLSELESPVAAAVYRIAQEAITNARKHAAGASFINVNCTITPDQVILQVANDGIGDRWKAPDEDSGGFGLIGMEERVSALGGTLSAGPAPRNGWNVVAHIPRQGSSVQGNSPHGSSTHGSSTHGSSTQGSSTEGKNV